MLFRSLGQLAKLFNFTERRKPDSPHTVELHSIQKSDVDMYELHVEEKSASINTRLSELKFGKEVVISSIVRDGKIIMPKGYTKLKENDILYVLAKSAHIDEIDAKINSRLLLDPQ